MTVSRPVTSLRFVQKTSTDRRRNTDKTTLSRPTEEGTSRPVSRSFQKRLNAERRRTILPSPSDGRVRVRVECAPNPKCFCASPKSPTASGSGSACSDRLDAASRRLQSIRVFACFAVDQSAMPIYEFALPQVLGGFSLPFQTNDPGQPPTCPKCRHKQEMAKQMSRFAMTKGLKNRPQRATLTQGDEGQCPISMTRA